MQLAASLIMLTALARSATAQVVDTPGTFAVNASGAATYSIPIQAPPGVAGLEPKLSLEYSSQAPNSALGMGWSLGGLSTITRCPRMKALDGVRGAIAFDANDRFCMDGKRLVMVSGSTYGAAGTEYRTELDVMSQLKAFGAVGTGPSYFVVKTKSGLTMEYGNTTDSKLLSQSGAVVRTWALNKVTDVKGNTLVVQYTVAADRSSQLPLSVSYGGNAGTANPLVVAFTYSGTRPDSFKGYQAGSAIGMNNLLTTITTKIANTTTVREYRLAYETAALTGKSRLTSVKECDSTGKCLRPTTFGAVAQQSGDTFLAVKSGAAVAGSTGNFDRFTAKPVDIDGDGISDLVYVGSGSWGWAVYAWRGRGDGTFAPFGPGAGIPAIQQAGNFDSWSVDVADLNGDGLADVLLTYADGSGAKAYAWRGRGDGTFTALNNGNPGLVQSGNFAFSTRRITDLDGDGIADLVYSWSGPPTGTPEGFVYAWRGAGDGTFTPYNNAAKVVSAPEARMSVWDVVDVNGDGIGDILLSCPICGNGATVFIWRGRGDGTFTALNGGASVISQSGQFVNAQTRYADINGDGVMDIVIVSALESGATAYAWLGRGDGTFAPANGGLPVISKSGTSFKDFKVEIADINGDGRSDIIFMLASTGAVAYAWLGQGDGLFTAMAGGAPVLSAPGGDQYAGGRPFLVDINGDGAPDLLYASANAGGHYAYAWKNSNSPINDLLGSISTGSGATTRISYDSLSGGTAVYTKDTGADAATYPKLDLRVPSYVVSSSTSNGGAGEVTTQYAYGGLKAELGTGRGVLGFRWLRAKNLTTNLETTTKYWQNFPYTGMISGTETRLQGAGSNGLLKTSGSSMNFVTTIGSALFAYTAGTSEVSWDLGGQSLPTVTITFTYGQSPQFGDPTNVTVGINDGSTESTVNEYFPADTTNWVIGRLKKTTVTRSKP